MTGERRFFKFARPCLEERLKRDLITRELFDRAINLVKSRESPTREFLQQCFPFAVKRLLEFSGVSDIQDDRAWSYENVGKFWDGHVGIDGVFCNVFVATVILVFGRFVFVRNNGLPTAVLNEYNLDDLRPGDQIRIHISTAIEKVDS